MRNYRVTDDKAAVSLASQETAFNAGQTLDVSLMITEGDIPTFERRRDKNEGELTGKEEPDTIYDRGRMANMNFTFDKAKPHEILFLAAYCLGEVSTAAAGTGYEHTITPLSGDIDHRRSLPSFSIGYRFSQILDRIYHGAVVDSLSLGFTKDEFVKVSGSVKMSGKTDDNVAEDTIAAALNVTSLTLSDGVAGSTDAERLDNMQVVRYESLTGQMEHVDFSAVSSDTAAGVLSITAPSAATDVVDYKAIYAKFGENITFPAMITESPLTVAKTVVTFGGKWNGTAFVGGRTMACELKSVTWDPANGMATEFCFGVDADYANRAWREARTQTLKIDREFRDFLMQQMIENEEYFGLHILATGAVYDSPHKFQCEVVFPRLSIISAPIAADGKRLSESADIAVLQDDNYGSVIVKVKNQVPQVMG